jgi:hypothetical protein
MAAPRLNDWLFGRARPAIDARVTRDPRVDVVRGLALLMIFVNHIPGNPLSNATLAAFTFNDAAEVFVLLAGYSAMLAYHRGFAGGLAAGAAPILRRVRTIYQVQVALALVLVLMGLALTAVTGRAFYTAHLNLADFAAEPLRGMIALFALLFQPSYADILPMYVVLMGALPLVIAGLARSPIATLTASAAIYAGTNVFALNAPQIFETTWFFNPFAWQLIFVTGAAMAHAALTGVRLPRHADGIVAAAAILLFAVAVKAPWTTLGLPGGPVAALGLNPLDFSKTWAHPMRLATLGALIYLGAVLLDPRADWLRHGTAERLQALGRISLPAFALGTVLSFVGTAVMTEAGNGIAIVVGVNAVGIALLLTMPALMLVPQRLASTRQGRVTTSDIARQAQAQQV